MATRRDLVTCPPGVVNAKDRPINYIAGAGRQGWTSRHRRMIRDLTVLRLLFAACFFLVVDRAGSTRGLRREGGRGGSEGGGGGGEEDRGEPINAVRCRVRCLTLLQNNLEPSVSAGVRRDTTTLLNCLQEPDCETCLRPCNQPFVSVVLCEEACRPPAASDDRQCRESCRFLKSISGVRRGTCPPTGQAKGFTALCVNACSADTDCDQDLKCCSNGCGQTCQNPLQANEGLPDIPDRPAIRERPRGGSVELRWTAGAPTNFTPGGAGVPGWVGGDEHPILYVVESRWNIGRLENEAEMSPWQQIAQTTGTTTVVNDITPGHWYQFRVTAVNIYGTRGGSLPTKAFTSSREPKRPGPPTNVTEGDTLIMGGKVAVNLHWFQPTKSDLPISRYKFFWNKKARGSSSGGGSGGGNSASPPPVKERRAIIPGTAVMFQLPDLDPDTTYEVQIQTICQFGEARLKSERVSISITTYPLPKSAENQMIGSRSMQPSNPVRSLPTPAAPGDLAADQPFFQNGVLKANITWSSPASIDVDRLFVSWSPEACIADSLPDDGLAKVKHGNTQDRYFVIYDLRFDCRYTVRVHSATNQGVSGPSGHLVVATPPCYDVIVVSGTTKPDCPNSAVLRLPDEPADLQHSFIIGGANITARITWSAPPTTNAPITGYLVVWGQIAQSAGVVQGGGGGGGGQPSLDRASMIHKVLPKDVRLFVIGYLLEGTTYVVRVQARSRAGAGRAASVQFTTPLLQIPIDPPYRDVNELPDRSRLPLPHPPHPPPLDDISDDDDDDDDDVDYSQRLQDSSSVVRNRQLPSNSGTGPYRSYGCRSRTSSQSLTAATLVIVAYLVTAYYDVV